MRRGRVSSMALAMPPGCEQGSGPRMATAARDGGCGGRMWIPGRIVISMI